MANTLTDYTKRFKSIDLEIRMESLLRMLVGLCTGSVLFIVGTGIVYGLLRDVANLSSVLGRPSTMLILSQFNLTSENTLATWYSSMMQFGAGLLALLCYLAREDTGESRSLKWGWLMIALIFTALSIDEFGSLGDNTSGISSSALFGVATWEFKRWILSGLLLLFMLIFLLREMKLFSSAFWLMIVGTLLLLSMPFQQYFETKMWNTNEEAWTRPLSWALAAEGAELLASLSFLAGMVFHLLPDGVSVRAATIRVRFSRTVFRRTLVASLIVFTGAFIFVYATGTYHGSNSGITVNWFPSALAIVLFMILLLFRVGRMRWVLCYLALLSGYFGSNFYALIHWDQIAILSYVVRLGMLGGLVYFVFTLSILSRDTTWRLTHLAGGLLIGSGFVFDHPLVTFPVAMGLAVILYQHFRVWIK